MRERLAALRRLSSVYELVEEMHSAEARRAAAAAAEAQGALLAQETRTHEARMSGREALLMDDRTGWSVAVVREEIADRRKKQLEPIFEEREEKSEEARERYLASRLWTERMKSLVDSASTRIIVEEERRAQAGADDRFLARRQWKQRTRENSLRER